MPRFMLTGTYSAAAAKGMVDNPSDREEAARKIVEASGGQLECWYASTGPTDFVIIGTIDDLSDLMAGVMAGASSGTFGHLETQQLFSGDEFTAIQKRAGELRSSYVSAA
jgi:uncharacterized protein with GYD domain